MSEKEQGVKYKNFKQAQISFDLMENWLFGGLQYYSDNNVVTQSWTVSAMYDINLNISDCDTFQHIYSKLILHELVKGATKNSF